VTTLHPSCAAINGILEAAGLPGRVVILAEPAPTAAIAARLLGVEVGAIANSLVFATDEGDPVLVLTSGAHRVDTVKVAAHLGTAALHRASAELVRSATGQPIGGVAPFGHPAPLRTLIDVDLAGYPELWAAAGIPHSVFPIGFDDLVRLSGADPVAVV
jgi:prolyl-tRNA editing enzyme YbaK/EbsC (Cys-tRNA(Pro) deacylase)